MSSVVNCVLCLVEYHKVNEVMCLGNILAQEYEENVVMLRVDLPQSLAGKLKKYTIEDEERSTIDENEV